MDIIPKPNKQPLVRQGRYTLPSVLHVETGAFEPWCLAAFIGRFGFEQSIEQPEDDAWLRLIKNEALLNEGYRLQIDKDGIVVEAADAQGIVWALTTVAELADSSRSLPILEMEEAPRFRHRGLMLDCARHFFPIDEVKRIIEQISLVKMNVLHWHLSDDQGWRIESKRFPLLHERCDEFYTQAEIRDVVEYARLRGVEIIPEIDMPGHTLGLLAAYPKYSCSGDEVDYASCGGIYRTILCPGKEETFRFLEALLEEMCGLFPSQRFHIGGDEAPKNEWKVCPACNRRKAEEQLESWEDLQGYFSLRVAELLRGFGKLPVLWNDAIKASKLPENMAVQYWNPQFKKDIQQYVEGGGSYVYSDMFELYFDYPPAMTPLRRVYHICPSVGNQAAGKIGAETNSYEPIGIEACLWTEHIRNRVRLERLLFPRLFAVAERAWSREPDYDGFLQRLHVKMERSRMADIACTPVEECNPQGRKRRREAVDFLSSIGAAMTPEARKDSVETTATDIGFMWMFLTKFLKLTDLPSLVLALRKKL